jgi:hypothetical protein
MDIILNNYNRGVGHMLKLIVAKDVKDELLELHSNTSLQHAQLQSCAA